MEWDSDILFIYLFIILIWMKVHQIEGDWHTNLITKKKHQKANGPQHSPEEIMALKPNNFFLSNWDYFYA